MRFRIVATAVAMCAMATEASSQAKPKTPVLAAPTIAGVVKGPDGKPLAQALVIARSVGRRDDAMPPTCRTDAEGRFQLRVPAAGVFDIRVEASGWASRRIERVRPGPPLVVTLERGGFIQGIVRDAVSREPAVGARVEARSDATLTFEPEAGAVVATSDAKGQFRLDGIGPGFHDLTARHPRLGSASRSGVIAGARVELFLIAGAGIGGVVMDATGKPCRGAVVRVEREERWSDPAVSARTDSAGRYQIAGLSPGSYRVIAFSPGSAPGLSAGVTVEGSGEATVDLTLGVGATVRGRLVGPGDRPVAGRVVVREIGGVRVPASVSPLLRAEAAADGRFRIEHVPAGAHALDAQPARFASKRVDGETSDGAEADVGDIVFETGNTIRGHVRDTAARPISGATVSCFVQGSPSGYSEATSGADGSFELLGQPPGMCLLSVRALGYGPFRKSVEVGTEKLEIVLSAGATLTGQAVGETGAPVDSFDVFVQPAGESTIDASALFQQKGIASADGRFAIEDLGPATYSVQVTAPDRAPATVSGVKVETGALVDLGVIRLRSGGTVIGTVTDAQGAPVVGAAVSVQPPGMDFTGAEKAQTSSNAAGNFELRGVSPGAAVIQVRHPAFAPASVPVAEVEPSQGPTEVKVVMLKGGRVEGMVLARDPNKLQGLSAQILPNTPEGYDFSLEPDAMPIGPDGRFAFDHVAPGRVAVMLLQTTATGRRTSLRSRDATVIEAGIVQVDFTLRDILVTGRATRTGASLSGARITLRPGARGFIAMMSVGVPSAASAPQRLTGVIGEDGGFELLVDEPGQYSVWIETVDRKTVLPRRNVVVPDAESFSLDLDFSGSKVSGVVVDKESGDPIAHARITVFVKNPAPEASPRGGSGTSGADGSFQLELDPGRYRLEARADHYSTELTDLDLDENGTTELRLQLARGTPLVGRIVDGRGRPVGSLDVSATPANVRDGVGESAFSEQDGSFQFSGLPIAPYNLFAGNAAAGFAFRAAVTPGDDEVKLTLRRGGRLRLLARAADGVPVEGAEAWLGRIGDTVVDTSIFATTDASGIAEMTLPAGWVDLQVQKDRSETTVRLNIPEGGQVETEVQLVPVPEKRQ